MNSYNSYQTYNNGSTVLSFAKIFAYMIIGLLITGGAAALSGWGLTVYISTVGQVGVYVLIAVAVTCIVVSFICSTVMNMSMLRKGRYSIPLIIAYALALGGAVGCMCVFVPWQLIAGSFLVTSLIFAVLSMIALIFKRSNLNMLAVVGSALFVGAGLMFLFAWIFMLLVPGFAYWVYAVYMLVTFAAIMLVTIYDVWRINQIVEMGQVNRDVSIYCAITLYNDFINIFLRVLYFAIRIFGNSR